MTRWVVILSTVSFGKRVEVRGQFVYGDTEEQALAMAEAVGADRLTGYKFERVEVTR